MASPPTQRFPLAVRQNGNQNQHWTKAKTISILGISCQAIQTQGEHREHELLSRKTR